MRNKQVSTLTAGFKIAGANRGSRRFSASIFFMAAFFSLFTTATVSAQFLLNPFDELYWLRGNVGVGTNDPSRLMHLYYNNTNTVTSHLYLEQAGTGDAFMQFGLTGGRHYAMGIDNSDGDIFKVGTFGTGPRGVNTNTLLSLTPTGMLGIGIDNPTATLDVNGDLRLHSTNNNTFRMFTDTDGDFKFVADGGAVAMTITDESARVGIGTSAPSGALEVRFDSDYNRPTIELTEEGTDAARIYFRNTTNGDRRFNLGANPGNANPRFNIGFNNGSGSVDIFSVDGDNHRVGIMTDNVPAGYRLGVNGRIICEELRVQLSSAWPDYVFENSYRLPSLYELEKSIRKNKHLPGIPSAAEVEKEGISVGDMQTRMMVKLEELTLYVIDLKKENDALKAEVEKLKSK